MKFSLAWSLLDQLRGPPFRVGSPEKKSGWIPEKVEGKSSHLHIAVHGCKFVHFSLFPSTTFLYRFIIIIELIVRNRPEIRPWAIRPVISRASREACRVSRPEHGGVGRPHPRGVQLSWNKKISKLKKKCLVSPPYRLGNEVGGTCPGGPPARTRSSSQSVTGSTTRPRTSRKGLLKCEQDVYKAIVRGFVTNWK